LIEQSPVPPEGAALREAIVRTAQRTFEIGAGLAWRSHDPFDLLLSPYFRWVPTISSYAARILVQIGKRSGATTRRVLRVPRHEEAKALAEFLRAALIMAQSGESWAEDYVVELSQRLRALAVITNEGWGWGIEFPHVSRFGLAVPRRPTIYVTTVSCHALLDEYELTGASAALKAAQEGCRFIVDGFGSFEYAGRQWLRYSQGQESRIINVQSSAASLLSRFGVILNEDRLLQTADRAAEVVIASQRKDGSWPYSDDGQAPFVDGFHTGFTLQGLAEYASLRGREAISGVNESVRSGLAFFKQHLITADGMPRGVAGGSVSLDGQNLGQCIQTLLVCGSSVDAETALRMWDVGFGVDLRSGRLPSQSRLPALRWVLGPAVQATAYLLRAYFPVGSRSGRALSHLTVEQS
jgi:hypothetical protein